MSTAKTTPWKTIAIGFIILTVAFGAVAGAAVYEMVSLNNQKQDLASQIETLKSQVAKDNQTITALNSQITSLNGQVSSLQTQLSNLEKPNVIVSVSYTISPSLCILPNPFGGGCLISQDGSGTVNAVAFANTGTATAYNVQVTVTFRLSTGAPLCSLVIPLASSVNGQTVNGILPSSNNSCDTGPYPVTAYNATSVVTWS